MDIQFSCQHCNTPAVSTANWAADRAKHMVKHQACFTCSYWLELIAEKDEHFIANGVCYSVGTESPTNPVLRGHGGRRFVIQPFNGDQIVSTNVWYQGPVPERFRDQLPDNATIGPPENTARAISAAADFLAEGF